MAKRQALCNMLNINDKLSDEMKDTIIAAFQKGVEHGERKGIFEGRQAQARLMRKALGIEEGS